MSGFIPTDNLTYDQYIDYVKNDLNNFSNVDVLILTMLCEEYPDDCIEKINNVIKAIKHCYTHLEILVFAGTQYLRKDYLGRTSVRIQNEYVYYINVFWYTLYYQLIKTQICQICQSYNRSNRDFLLLIGKPDRKHRTEILYKLYEQNLLDNALWKFFIHTDIVKQNCRQILHYITDEQFETFIQSVNKKLDDVPVLYYEDTSHFSGLPFDYNVFNSAKFQVIIETDFNSSIISEKTYIPILNKRPFIMVSAPDHNLQLRQYGFKTFENYCLHKDYQEQRTSDNERYNQIMDNIAYWIENIDKNYDQISNDVEHNFNLFVQLGKQEENNIIDIIEKHNINAEPNQIIKGYWIN